MNPSIFPLIQPVPHRICASAIDVMTDMAAPSAVRLASLSDTSDGDGSEIKLTSSSPSPSASSISMDLLPAARITELCDHLSSLHVLRAIPTTLLHLVAVMARSQVNYHPFHHAVHIINSGYLFFRYIIHSFPSMPPFIVDICIWGYIIKLGWAIETWLCVTINSSCYMASI
jgi:hypothetical protein